MAHCRTIALTVGPPFPRAPTVWIARADRRSIIPREQQTVFWPQALVMYQSYIVSVICAIRRIRQPSPAGDAGQGEIRVTCVIRVIRGSDISRPSAIHTCRVRPRAPATPSAPSVESACPRLRVTAGQGEIRVIRVIRVIRGSDDVRPSPLCCAASPRVLESAVPISRRRGSLPTGNSLQDERACRRRVFAWTARCRRGALLQ